jgi:WD40 repeat protein
MAKPDIHLKSGDLSMEVTKSAFLVNVAAYSPDGKFVLAGGRGNKLMLWDVTAGKQIRQFEGHSGSIKGVGFSPDGKYAFSGSWDRTIKLWDISTGKVIKTLDLGEGVIWDTVFSPDGKYAMSAPNSTLSSGERIKVWDLYKGTQLKQLKLGTWVWNKGGDLPIAFSPDSNYALTKDADGSVTLWKIPEVNKIKTFTQGKDSIYQVAFSPDAKKIAMVGIDGHTRFASPIRKLIDVSTGREIWRIKDKWSQLIFASTKFSPDGTSILTARQDADLRLWDALTGVEMRRKWPKPYLNVYWGTRVNFSPDGKYAVNNTQSAIRIFNISTGEEIAMMVGFEDGEWLAITSEGYYNSSEKGAQYLNVNFEGNDYTVDQFYDVFYRPDIVAAKLQGEDIKDLITITMQDATKSPPPAIEFTTIPTDTSQPKTKVCYQVKNTGGGIGEVRLFHNGKLIQSDGYYRDMAKFSSEKQQILAMNSKAIYDNMRSVSIKGKTENAPTMAKPKGDVFEDCRELEAVSGENEVSITAFNSGNTVQSPVKTVKFDSARPPEDPHLYILSIGIDKYRDTAVTLKYAAKDAADIEQKLLTQSATVYNPRNIHYELLTDEKAGKGNIMNKINELSRIIKPQDGFILFAAGHGVLLQNQYYMLTSDYDGMVNDSSVISSNEIVEMSKKIKSLSQLFIFDTCHAGGVDSIVSGLYDARMSVLAKKMGLHIYASANSIQEAQDGYQGNGLFTYTLLDGLNNKKEADKNNDNIVSLVELGEYAKQTTTEISKKTGRSQTPLIINFGKDYPVYNLR